MQKLPALSSVIGISLALAFGSASAQSTPELLEQLKVMRQQLEEQRARVDALERQLRAGAVASAPATQLDNLRGTGPVPAQPQQQDALRADAAPPAPGTPVPAPAPLVPATPPVY